MKHLYLISLFVCHSYHINAADIRDTYQGYLDNIDQDVPARERTFEPGDNKFSEDYLLRLGLEARKYQDIVVFFDTSGSTKLKAKAPPTGPEEAARLRLLQKDTNEKIREAFANSTIPKKDLFEHLVKTLPVGERFAPRFLNKDYIANAIALLCEDKPLPEGPDENLRKTRLALEKPSIFHWHKRKL